MSLLRLEGIRKRFGPTVALDGVDFEPSFLRRMTAKLDGVDLHFICLDDFKVNKKAVGRHQDLADLEALEGAKKP